MLMKTTTKVIINILLLFVNFKIFNNIIGNWANDLYEDFGIHKTEAGIYSGYNNRIINNTI